MSGPGACVSGELRTFFAPCVGEQMRDNLLLPLRLRTHIFMNARTLGNDTEERVRRVFKGVDITAEVEHLPSAEKPPCPVQSGYPLTRGLVKCFHSFRADAWQYTWIVRIRSDHMVPFRMHKLPCALCYYRAHPWASGIVLTASLADCSCGWARPSCSSERSYCDWVDDQFALLHGSAIDSYFGDLRFRFCDHHFYRLPSFADLGFLHPERRLARTVRNSTVHDMRFISAGMHPRLQRTMSCDKPRDGRRLPSQRYPTFEVPSRSIGSRCLLDLGINAE